MKLLLFADESGNLGLKSLRYFVITILIIQSYNEYRKLEKISINFRKNKFKKELKYKKELKAYKPSKKLKIEMIDALNNLNIKTISIYIDKKNPKFKNMQNKVHKNEIYIELITELIKNINIKKPIILRTDNHILRKYRKLFKKNVYKEIQNYKNKSEIYHVASEKYVGIQYADLIAWCMLKSLEDENNFYIKKLNKKHQIIEYKIK